MKTKATKPKATGSSDRVGGQWWRVLAWELGVLTVLLLVAVGLAVWACPPKSKREWAMVALMSVCGWCLGASRLVRPPPGD